MDFLAFIEAMSGIERLAAHDLVEDRYTETGADFYINMAVGKTHQYRSEAWIKLSNQAIPKIEKPEFVGEENTNAAV